MCVDWRFTKIWSQVQCASRVPKCIYTFIQFRNTIFLSTAAYAYSGSGSLSEAIEAVLVDTAYSTPLVDWCGITLVPGLSTAS